MLRLISVLLITISIQFTQTKSSFLFRDSSVGGGSFLKYLDKEPNLSHSGPTKSDGGTSSPSTRQGKSSSSKHTTPVSNDDNVKNSQAQYSTRYQNLRRLIDELGEEEEDDWDEYAEFGSWGNFPNRSGATNRYIHGTTGEVIDSNQYEKVFKKANAKNGLSHAVSHDEVNTASDVENDSQSIETELTLPEDSEEVNISGEIPIVDDRHDFLHQLEQQQSQQSIIHQNTIHEVPQATVSESTPSPQEHLKIAEVASKSIYLPNNKSLFQCSSFAVFLSMLAFASVKPFSLPVVEFQQQFTLRTFTVIMSFLSSMCNVLIAKQWSQIHFNIDEFISRFSISYFLLFPFLVMSEVIVSTLASVVALRLFSPSSFEENRHVPGILVPWVSSLPSKVCMIIKVALDAWILPFLHIYVFKRIITGRKSKSSEKGEVQQPPVSLLNVLGMSCGLKCAQLSFHILRSFHHWQHMNTPTNLFSAIAPILQGFIQGLIPFPEVAIMLVLKSQYGTSKVQKYLGLTHAFALLVIAALRGQWKPYYNLFSSQFMSFASMISPIISWRTQGIGETAIKYGLNVLYNVLILQAIVAVLRFYKDLGTRDTAARQLKENHF